MHLKTFFGRVVAGTAMVVTLYGCPPETPDPPPVAPVASFSYTSTRNVPVTVNFVNTSTSHLPGPSTYVWDFGDGTGSSILTNPVHIYAVAGTYNVRLVQVYADGSKDTVTQALSLSPAGPSGISTTPNGITATNFSFSFIPSFKVTFTNKSTNADAYNWDFGNGTTSASTAATVESIYTGNGPFMIILKATGPGGQDTCSAKISF